MKPKHLFLLLLTAYTALEVSAQPLQTFVEEKLQQPVFQGALWGGIAMPAQHPQDTLFAVNADTRLAPASTLKLVTTAAALEIFGPHHRFETKLYRQGPLDSDGTLNGALYLQGGGDMTLGSTRVTGAETWQTVAGKWAKAVQQAGIRKIKGGLYADVSIFEGPSVSPKVNWENMGNYFAAPASPLCLNDNLFEIHFKPQLRGHQPAEVDYTLPQLPGLQLHSFVTTDASSNKDNAYVYGAPGQYELKIFGTIPTSLRGFTIKGALPDPAFFALLALRQALQEKGITVEGELQLLAHAPDYPTFQLLHLYQSPELKDIVVIVNKRSFNLYADMLLRHLALHAGQKGSVENGITQLKKFLTERGLAGPQDVFLYDGSGLARDNLITPRTLANVLNYMTKSPHFDYYYKSLATPDDRGDLLVLRRFLKPLKKVDEVRVKGGTIDHVKAAAGYVRSADGQLISFVLMANNLAEKDESLFRIHEDIIKELLKTK